MQPAEAIGELCRAAEVPYLVDACQAVGQMPVDAARLHCDYLAGTSRKVLRGPRGVGFLYVAERVLAEQAWIHEPGRKVAQALQEAGFEVIEFRRLALAE